MEFSTRIRPKDHVFNTREVAKGIFVVTNAYEGKPAFFLPEETPSAASEVVENLQPSELVVPEKECATRS